MAKYSRRDAVVVTYLGADHHGEKFRGQIVSVDDDDEFETFYCVLVGASNAGDTGHDLIGDEVTVRETQLEPPPAMPSVFNHSDLVRLGHWIQRVCDRSEFDEMRWLAEPHRYRLDAWVGGAFPSSKVGAS